MFGRAIEHEINYMRIAHICEDGRILQPHLVDELVVRVAMVERTEAIGHRFGGGSVGPVCARDRAVLAAVVAGGAEGIGFVEIAALATAIGGRTIHHVRHWEPNVRTALDRLEKMGLVRDIGYRRGKAVTAATETGAQAANELQGSG